MECRCGAHYAQCFPMFILTPSINPERAVIMISPLMRKNQGSEKLNDLLKIMQLLDVGP